MSNSSIQDIFDAYYLILSPADRPTLDFVRHLQLPALKTAYRKKALETHPDRSKVVGKIESELNNRFQEVCRAYEILRTAIQRRTTPVSEQTFDSQNKQTPKKSAVHQKENDSNLHYKGIIPDRILLTGQYLYYSGLISWQALIKAIHWQQRQRPPIGQIARQWGILSSYDIKNILIERSWEKGYDLKFADYALKRGYITSFEHMALLGKQKCLQRPIGEYFIGKKILSPQELSRILKKLTIHNRNTIWTCRSGQKKRNREKKNR